MVPQAEMLQWAARYHQEGNLAQAEEICRQLLQVDPRNVEARHLLGIMASQTGNYDVGIALLREAIALNPTVAAYHSNLGLALEMQGCLAEAAECFRRALQIDPNYIKALFNLAKVLFKQNQFAEAADCYRQALRKNPKDAPAHYNLGCVYLRQDLFAEAAACFRQALALNPNYADAHNDLGQALFTQGQLGEAAACFDNALRIDPNFRKALWNRSCLRLLQGDFENGWRDFQKRENLRSLQQPVWDGAHLAGKTILAHVGDLKRGLGDTIQFVRYLPLIGQRGGRVVLECQPALVRLLRGFPGIDQLIPFGASLPPFDVHISVFDLPAVFGSTFATIPSAKSYLSADPDLIEHWRRELVATVVVGSALNIGIVWQGSTWQWGDSRSLSLSQFEPLSRVEGVTLRTLQVGPGLEQLGAAPFAITDLGSKFNPDTLDDLAAAMMNLDLVVTEDTGVAHLAGALGLPVWVALQLVPEWRWFLDRTDSPWYPTMRLFRQRKLGAWGEVFERMAAEIRERYTEAKR